MTKDPSITTLSSREVYRNHWMRVREDEILRSNGQRGIYGVVEKEDGAIIIPIDVDQTGCERIWLVEQYRYTIQERVLELPQGAWERAIDNPEELARGELKEETGLEADRMTYLGFNWIAYGFVRQRHHVFLAGGLRMTENEPDAEEHDIAVRSVPVADFQQMMLDGKIRDGCTQAAWAIYLMWKAQRG
ncbi:MAG: NUDIX hydrolase [Terracidiphilus sp.]